jgi:formylglycine-generating enzyme required for sulfatase activity
VAWHYDNSQAGNNFGTQKTTRPVGTKAPNELGIYDMSGNVWAWCQDVYAPYPCDKKMKIKSYRVLRGGAWGFINWGFYPLERNRDNPEVWYNNLGFRLAR